MSGTLAPGKQWTVAAGVSIFTFHTIESPITMGLIHQACFRTNWYVKPVCERFHEQIMIH